MRSKSYMTVTFDASLSHYKTLYGLGSTLQDLFNDMFCCKELRRSKVMTFRGISRNYELYIFDLIIRKVITFVLISSILQITYL